MTTVLAHVHKGLATVEEDGVVHTPRIFSVRIGFHDGFRHRQV